MLVAAAGVMVVAACATGNLTGDDDDDASPANDATTGDAGSCANGQTSCNGTCTSTTSDPKNCGKCANACASGQVCSQGTCAANCSGGTTKCGSSCVDTNTDPQNCGKCSAPCASGDGCDGGTCIPSCTSGQKLCDDGGLFCANIATDVENCGDCNVVCPAQWTCQQNGRCLPNCGTQTLCDIDGGTQGDGGPFCTNVDTDNQNCGTCDHACTGNTYCDAGGCATNPVTTCKLVNGLTWCYHAGTCGEACDTVCNYFNKTPVNASTWTAAQDTQQLCQNLATAFNDTSTPSVASYTYACAEVNGTTTDAGTVTGAFYCSTDTNCPSVHLTDMDGLGNACSTAAWVSICPCQ
jgi:hypothetical protein